MKKTVDDCIFCKIAKGEIPSTTIYEDDDYDWERYQSDDDYAAGVDDAMEDEDW